MFKKPPVSRSLCQEPVEERCRRRRRRRRTPKLTIVTPNKHPFDRKGNHDVVTHKGNVVTSWNNGPMELSRLWDFFFPLFRLLLLGVGGEVGAKQADACFALPLLCSCAKTGKLVLTQGAKQAGRRLCLCLCSALALLFCSRRKEIFRRSPPPVRASRVFIFIPSSCHLSELVSCHFILLFVSFAAHSHYEPTCTIANAHQRRTLGRRRRRVG